MTRQRIEKHTLACHLWCCDLDINWLKQPPCGRGQAQPEPNSAKLPQWRRNAKKIQRKGRPIVPEPGQRKAHAAVSDPRRPPVKVRGPRSSGWRDMPNEILIPLQSLVSVSSNILGTGGQQGAQLRDSGEASPQHVPKVLSAEPQ